MNQGGGMRQRFGAPEAFAERMTSMEKPDTGSDFFTLLGMMSVFIFLFRREIAAEWRELRGKRSKQRSLSGPLKRPPLYNQDLSRLHEKKER